MDTIHTLNESLQTILTILYILTGMMGFLFLAIIVGGFLKLTVWTFNLYKSIFKKA